LVESDGGTRERDQFSNFIYHMANFVNTVYCDDDVLYDSINKIQEWYRSTFSLRQETQYLKIVEEQKYI